MRFNPEHLRTLATLVDEGSFESAASQLGVTPSAVSQRMRALEEEVGRVLVTRSRPTRPTASGEILLRYARQMQSLLQESARTFGDDSELTSLVTVTAHADSLSSWVLPALAKVHSAVFQLSVDEGDDARDLRDARASLAITRTSTVIQGCTSEPLGKMRYFPSASPDFIATWFPDGVTPDAVARAPFVARTPAGPLPTLRASSSQPTPVTYIPTSADMVTAVEAGLGWAMLPERHIEGRAIKITDPARSSDASLHLSYWLGESSRLESTIDAIRQAASAALSAD